MLTKGQITSVDYASNKIYVRIPLFENTGDSNKAILEARLSIVPGIYNSYNKDDIVWVAFSEDQIDLPVVIGKFYKGASDEKNATSVISGSMFRLPAESSIISSTSLNNNKDYSEDKYGTIEKLISTNINISNEVDLVWDKLNNVSDLVNIDTKSIKNLTTTVEYLKINTKNLSAKINTKQNKLTAGSGIEILTTNKIKVKDSVLLDISSNKVDWFSYGLSTLSDATKIDISAGIPNIGENTNGCLGKDGIYFKEADNNNDAWWIRSTSTDENNHLVEFATGDDGNSDFNIHFRAYNTSDQITTDITLPKYSGTTLVYEPINGGVHPVKSQEWGTQTGSVILAMDDNTGGSVALRKNCPYSGQMSLVIDGTVYVNEGSKPVIYLDSFSDGVAKFNY